MFEDFYNECRETRFDALHDPENYKMLLKNEIEMIKEEKNINTRWIVRFSINELKQRHNKTTISLMCESENNAPLNKTHNSIKSIRMFRKVAKEVRKAYFINHIVIN